MEQRASVTDFRLADETDAGGIGGASAAISVAGLTGQSVRLELAGEIDAVDVPLEGTYDPFVPNRAQLAVALEDLPIDVVTDTLHTVAVGVLVDADGDEMGDAFQGPLMDFMNSSATLEIASGIVEFENSAAFIDGHLAVDPQWQLMARSVKVLSD